MAPKLSHFLIELQSSSIFWLNAANCLKFLFNECFLKQMHAIHINPFVTKRSSWKRKIPVQKFWSKKLFPSLLEFRNVVQFNVWRCWKSVRILFVGDFPQNRVLSYEPPAFLYFKILKMWGLAKLKKILGIVAIRRFLKFGFLTSPSPLSTEMGQLCTALFERSWWWLGFLMI